MQLCAFGHGLSRVGVCREEKSPPEGFIPLDSLFAMQLCAFGHGLSRVGVCREEKSTAWLREH